MAEPIISTVVIGLCTNAMYDLIRATGRRPDNDDWLLRDVATERVLADVSASIDEYLQQRPEAEIEQAHNLVRSPQARAIVSKIMTLRLAQAGGQYSAAIETELQTALRIGYRGDIASLAATGDVLFAGLVDHVDAFVRYSTLQRSSTASQIAQSELVRCHLAAIEKNLEVLASAQTADIDEYLAYERKLRDAVRSRHELIAPPQLEGAHKVAIESIYVQPRLQIEAGASEAHKAWIHRQSFEHDKDSVSIETSQHVVILGDPGGGKSTFAQMLAFSKSKRDSGDAVPILIVLRDYGAELRRNPLSIVEYIHQYSRAMLQVDAPEGAVDFMLLNGRAYVIFDGLDELLDTTFRQAVASNVQSFCAAYPSTPVLVTSRRVGYDQAPLDGRLFRTVHLGSFDRRRVREYVEKWFGADTTLNSAERHRKVESFIEESRLVPDLRSNPLMLGLMCGIYRGEGYIPRNRPDVYEKCALMLFDRWDRRRELRIRLDVDAHVDPLMRHIAHWLYINDEYSSGVDETALVEEATAYLEEWRYADRQEARVAAEQFVRFCRGRAWVFTDVGTTPVGDRLYHFTHRTFLEFFTAAHLVRQADSAHDLYASIEPRIERAEWDVVAQLAVQIQNKQTAGFADDLIRGLIERSRTAGGTEKANLLLFAAKCLSFVIPKPSSASKLAKYCLVEICREAPESTAGEQVATWHLERDDIRGTVGMLMAAAHENLSSVEKGLREALRQLFADDGDDCRSTAIEFILVMGSLVAVEVSHGDTSMEYWDGVRDDLVSEYWDELGPYMEANEWAARISLMDSFSTLDSDELLARYGLRGVFSIVESPIWAANVVPPMYLAVVQLLFGVDIPLGPDWAERIVRGTAQRILDGERVDEGLSIGPTPFGILAHDFSDGQSGIARREESDGVDASLVGDCALAIAAMVDIWWRSERSRSALAEEELTLQTYFEDVMRRYVATLGYAGEWREFFVSIGVDESRIRRIDDLQTERRPLVGDASEA